jgi:type IV pilus assembly protein PilM
VLSFSRKKDRLLGLDISSTGVKMVELSVQQGRYRVEKFGIEPLPANAVIDKNINDAEAIGESISRLVKRIKPSSKMAATAVSGSAVITKVIEMDKSMTDIERESQIRLDADQYIPYPLSEVNLDFEVLDEIEDVPGRVRVLLAASRSEIIDQRVDALALGDLQTQIVDIEAYAIERSFEHMAASLNGEPELVALIDIGHSHTTLYVLHHEKIIYSREQLFGGKQLTEEIQRKYGMSFEEAERSKHENLLPDDYQFEVLKPFMDSVVQQVTRSLQFFYSSSKFHNVEHIVVSGGTAAIYGLAELLEQNIGNPVTIANPFSQMMVSSKVSTAEIDMNAPGLMVACGLALRSFD